jgi:hypothetical protein
MQQISNQFTMSTRPAKMTTHFDWQQSCDEKADYALLPLPRKRTRSREQAPPVLNNREPSKTSRVAETSRHQLPCLTMTTWLLPPEKVTLCCPDHSRGGDCAKRFLGYPFVQIQQPWMSLLELYWYPSENYACDALTTVVIVSH